MNILIYNSGGGLGDSIQLFNIINSLNHRFKNVKIFYLGAHNNHFKDKNFLVEVFCFDLLYWIHL